MKKVDTDKVLKWVKSNLDRKKIYKIINQGISDRESDVLMKRVNKDLKLNIDTYDYKSQDWKDLDSAITSSINKVFAKMDESVILIESYDDFLNEGKSNFSGQLKIKDKISLDKLNKDFKNWEFSINPMNPHIQPGSTSKYILTYSADGVDDNEVKKVKSEISKLVESVEIISEIFVGKTGMDDAVNRLNNPRKYTLEDIEDAFKAGQKSDNWNDYKKKVLKIR